MLGLCGGVLWMLNLPLASAVNGRFSSRLPCQNAAAFPDDMTSCLTMRFSSASEVLTKRAVQFYRILQICPCTMRLAYPVMSSNHIRHMTPMASKTGHSRQGRVQQPPQIPWELMPPPLPAKTNVWG